MKSTRLIACATALLTFAAAPAALAKGKNDNKNPKGPPSAVYVKYDADHNGVLNVEEGETVRKDFAKNPNDPLLKPFDTNKDAVLSDAEIMAIRPTQGTAAQKKKKSLK
jgi:phosphate/sulfate permease